jgi:spore coat polysaccharide biosynthesis protein SpsF (cytidylyltransferase family)
VNILGTIIARLGSSRVPGKALLNFGGQPVVAHLARIAGEIEGVTDVCLATTTLPGDDLLVAAAARHSLSVSRGHPDNVLDRIYEAAAARRADIVVYIGGDCPLLDPAIVSRALAQFLDSDLDYLSNYDPPTFPGGLDINIVRMTALKRAFDCAKAPSQRIHAFSYLTFHADQFRIGNVAYQEDLSTYHWALDNPEDVTFLRAVYERLFDGRSIQMTDVLKLISSDAHIGALHEQILKPKAGHAFLSSAHMVKDFHADVAYLCGQAEQYLRRGELPAALECYREVAAITGKLGQA